MIYENSNVWKNAKQKKVLLFAMSGLGKTHVSSMLRAQGDWFHYSIDYRIGTRYMGEYIVDNFKKTAMADTIPCRTTTLRFYFDCLKHHL